MDSHKQVLALCNNDADRQLAVNLLTIVWRDLVWLQESYLYGGPEQTYAARNALKFAQGEVFRILEWVRYLGAEGPVLHATVRPNCVTDAPDRPRKEREKP